MKKIILLLIATISILQLNAQNQKIQYPEVGFSNVMHPIGISSGYRYYLGSKSGTYTLYKIDNESGEVKKHIELNSSLCEKTNLGVEGFLLTDGSVCILTKCRKAKKIMVVNVDSELENVEANELTPSNLDTRERLDIYADNDILFIQAYNKALIYNMLKREVVDNIDLTKAAGGKVKKILNIEISKDGKVVGVFQTSRFYKLFLAENGKFRTVTLSKTSSNDEGFKAKLNDAGDEIVLCYVSATEKERYNSHRQRIMLERVLSHNKVHVVKYDAGTLEEQSAEQYEIDKNIISKAGADHGLTGLNVHSILIKAEKLTLVLEMNFVMDPVSNDSPTRYFSDNALVVDIKDNSAKMVLIDRTIMRNNTSDMESLVVANINSNNYLIWYSDLKLNYTLGFYNLDTGEELGTIEGLDCFRILDLYDVMIGDNTLVFSQPYSSLKCKSKRDGVKYKGFGMMLITF